MIALLYYSIEIVCICHFNTYKIFGKFYKMLLRKMIKICHLESHAPNGFFQCFIRSV